MPYVDQWADENDVTSWRPSTAEPVTLSGHVSMQSPEGGHDQELDLEFQRALYESFSDLHTKRSSQEPGASGVSQPSQSPMTPSAEARGWFWPLTRLLGGSAASVLTPQTPASEHSTSSLSPGLNERERQIADAMKVLATLHDGIRQVQQRAQGIPTLYKGIGEIATIFSGVISQLGATDESGVVAGVVNDDKNSVVPGSTLRTNDSVTGGASRASVENRVSSTKEKSSPALFAGLPPLPEKKGRKKLTKRSTPLTREGGEKILIPRQGTLVGGQEEIRLGWFPLTLKGDWQKIWEKAKGEALGDGVEFWWEIRLESDRYKVLVQPDLARTGLHGVLCASFGYDAAQKAVINVRARGDVSIDYNSSMPEAA